MILSQKFQLLNRIRSFLESIWLVPIIFLIGSVCWWLSLSLVSVAVFAGVAMLIFLFCKKVNNFFAILFYVSFFIKNIYVGNTDWVGYIICIGMAVVFIIAFAIKMLIEDKPNIKKSKMAIAVIISSIAFLIGGVARFDGLVTLITFGLSLSTFTLYLISRYRTENLEKYLANVFIIGAIFLTANIYFHRILLAGSIFIGKPTGELFFFSAQPLNPASIFIMLAIVGCYRIGVGKKTDIVCFVMAIFFYASVVLTSCRTTIAIASVLMVVLYLLFLNRSEKKLYFVYLAFVLAILICAVWFVFAKHVNDLVDMLLSKISSGLNGRDELWPWCIERFKEYPVFGFGFVADIPVPSLSYDTNVVLAHNTVLQWLTSLGIVGTLLMCFAYFLKYKTVFSGAGKERYFLIISILAVEFTGMLDQAPSMDIFMYILSIVLVSACETLSKPQEALKISKKCKFKSI